MNPTVKRAGAFALVGGLSLAAPVLEAAAFVPFALVAIIAIVVVTDGALFELFAKPSDYDDGRLYGLTGFALAATGLGLLVMFGLPAAVFSATLCLIVGGNLAGSVIGVRRPGAAARTAAFTAGGTVAGLLAYGVAIGLAPALELSTAVATFLVTTGAILAALLRSLRFESDDPVVVLSVGLVLWFLAELGLRIGIGGQEVAVALGVTVILGYVSYALDTASVTGMLTGVLLGLLTIVLGGYAWFVVLISFFAIGGVATKYRYEEKARRGVAEENEGARSTGNVLSNSAVALLAVVGYAVSPFAGPPMATAFLFGFVGAVATALSDTLSSEIGGIYDRPRLITSLEPVEPGTNGAVTWQGILAGLVGAAIVAGLTLGLFASVTPVGATVVVVAGGVGMTADSLLGATVEGHLVDNQGVNFLATLLGAASAVGLAVLLGVA